MNTKTFGYVRVSSKTQNEARQVQAMLELGIDERNIFVDKQSGKDFNREKYLAMKNCLREGDLVVIKSIDRLGRNRQMMAEEWENLCKVIKVDIQVIDMPLLNTRDKKDLLGTFVSDLVFVLLSFFAEQERSFTKNRQKEGIEIAKVKGTKTGRPFGRPKKERPTNFDEVFNKWRNKDITARKAMQELNLTANVFYKFVHEKEERM